MLDAEVPWATIDWTCGCDLEDKNTEVVFVSKPVGYRPYKWFIRKCTDGIDMNINKKSGGFGKYLLMVLALRNLLVAVLWVPLFGTAWRLFYVHGSVHRESMSLIVQQDATIYSSLYFCKLLYMFRVVPPPIIWRTYNCNYTIWHWLNLYCYLPLS